jgi:hypothetical protein
MAKPKTKTKVIITRQKGKAFTKESKRQNVDTGKIINAIVGAKVIRKAKPIDKEKQAMEKLYTKALSFKQWQKLDNFMQEYIKTRARYTNLDTIEKNSEYITIDFAFCHTCKKRISFKVYHFRKQCCHCKSFSLGIDSYIKAFYYINPHERFMYNEARARIEKQVNANKGQWHNGFNTFMQGQATR